MTTFSFLISKTIPAVFYWDKIKLKTSKDCTKCLILLSLQYCLVWSTNYNDVSATFWRNSHVFIFRRSFWCVILAGRLSSIFSVQNPNFHGFRFSFHCYRTSVCEFKLRVPVITLVQNAKKIKNQTQYYRMHLLYLICCQKCWAMSTKLSRKWTVQTYWTIKKRNSKKTWNFFWNSNFHHSYLDLWMKYEQFENLKIFYHTIKQLSDIFTQSYELLRLKIYFLNL